jgi:hypothetical protein
MKRVLVEVPGVRTEREALQKVRQLLAKGDDSPNGLYWSQKVKSLDRVLRGLVAAGHHQQPLEEYAVQINRAIDLLDKIVARMRNEVK